MTSTRAAAAMPTSMYNSTDCGSPDREVEHARASSPTARPRRTASTCRSAPHRWWCTLPAAAASKMACGARSSMNSRPATTPTCILSWRPRRRWSPRSMAANCVSSACACTMWPRHFAPPPSACRSTASLALSAARVPLRALTAGVGGDTTYEGQVSLDARGESLPAAPWTGTVIGALDNAIVHHHLSGGRVESFSLGNGNVQAALDAERPRRQRDSRCRRRPATSPATSRRTAAAPSTAPGRCRVSCGCRRNRSVSSTPTWRRSIGSAVSSTPT